LSGRRNIDDRRLQPRFEVVGDLWGTLEAPHALQVVNVSAGGALIESARPWAIGDVHWIEMQDASEFGRAQIRVRHVREAPGKPGLFWVGVEFLSIAPALEEQVMGRRALEGDVTVES
jgi:hypothetical protein